MREDSTTSPDPQEPKRGYADPNEQAKRAPESTGKVNAQGQREAVGENIAKHKQEIAQDRPAEGQDTAERKARNASRDIETADVNVQKMKMLFGEIGKEQQKPSPERAARDTELKAMQGTGKVNAMKTEIEQQQKSAKAQEVAPAKATTQQAAPKEKVQQAAPKEKSASQSQSTAKPSRLAKIGEGFKKAGKAMASGIKKVGTKIAALASRKKGGASKTTGDTGQKGAFQQKG